MGKDLDHLTDLFVTPDRRRDLVLTGQFVHRDAEMTKKARKFVLLTRSFLLLFAFSNSRASRLCYLLGGYAKVLQHIVQNAAFVIGENVKDVASVDHPTPLRASAVHCPLEKLGRLGRDAKTLPGVLPAGVHALFDQQFHRS